MLLYDNVTFVISFECFSLDCADDIFLRFYMKKRFQKSKENTRL